MYLRIKYQFSYLLKLAPINYILNKLPVHGNGFNMNMFNMYVCPSVCLFYVVPLRGNYIFKYIYMLVTTTIKTTYTYLGPPALTSS